MPPDEDKKWWQAPWEFLVHSIVGTVIFVTIAAAAVGLDFAVRYLEAHNVNSIIVLGLMLVKYALFLVDILLFLVFIWRTGMRAYRNL